MNINHQTPQSNPASNADADRPAHALLDGAVRQSTTAAHMPKGGTLRIVISRGVASRQSEGRRDRRADRVLVHDDTLQEPAQQRRA